MPEAAFTELVETFDKIDWNPQMIFATDKPGIVFPSDGIPMADETKNIQFINKLYENGYSKAMYENPVLFDLFRGIEGQLNSIKLLKAKANLSMSYDKQYQFGMHVDMSEFLHISAHKTAILYLNDNDGYTLLEDGTKLLSKANRMVVFDGSTYHAPVNATNVNLRRVLNINFLQGEINE
jgi:hypothetical protein